MNQPQIVVTVVLVVLVVASTSTATYVYSNCYGDYCFYTDNQQWNEAMSFEAFQTKCDNMKPDSWPLEIYNEEMSINLRAFINGNSYVNQDKRYDVILNLKRRSTNWVWLDGKPYQNVSKNPPPQCSTSSSSTNFRIVDEVCYETVVNKDKQTSSWFQAQNSCVEKGGTLATLPKNIPADFNKTLAAITRDQQSYWIGLVRDYWSWIARPALIQEYTNWYNGYPLPGNLDVDPSKVFTFLDHYNGDIWKDFVDAKDISLHVICMTFLASDLSTPTSTTNGGPNNNNNNNNNNTNDKGVGILCGPRGLVCHKKRPSARHSDKMVVPSFEKFSPESKKFAI
ncbi:hypothetical protein HELRODRAFT_170616 [Helobdella robusta]|uniref:C-type lectin domain-containing protein n=1 Tax=Helobdella robusta TaxID=6412 RepID=T1F388_HELRO|nr:hypothetical protein HELRODRAFT_170616 [Helobdella robusta]ESO07287.1 hypothetical protein HELRODRAFT_170616 [Helobdella robusta]